MLTDAEQTELVEIDERQIEYIMGAFDFDKLREVNRAAIKRCQPQRSYGR
jgi:hypothetical protein